jgi:hypothetical protein
MNNVLILQNKRLKAAAVDVDDEGECEKANEYEMKIDARTTTSELISRNLSPK